MELVKLKSGSILEHKESYSRVVALDNWIFMSLTSGRDFATRIMPATTLEQARNAMKNVEGALAAVDCSLADVVRRRIFITRQEDVPDVMAYMGEVFRGVDPASCVSCGPLGGPEYLFEIEVTAYRGAGALAVKNLSISL
ncbi:RidA family protein [Ancylobacter sonchi]|uniref:Rid family hydrolase n=1 Tax=Ancylobacter sonchi TaxID=1937790 RepID=UPI001BD378D1|nr:Rid family hydrolase [Ancylobacter sonchi]MBS7536011.1 RidA family protein [Ancylobacter sonchi]